MLLRSIDAINSRGFMLALSLEDISAGYVVKKIEGLDPVKATLVSSSFANQDGEQYHSSRRVPRNIKIKLGLEPDYSVQGVKELRDQLYNFFMPENPITLGFNLFDKFAVSVFLDDLKVQIPGRIESFDSDMFTQDPEVDISIMCFNPDFFDPIPVVFSGVTVADLTQTILTYIGTIDTGVTFTLTFDRDVNQFTIYHQPPDNTMKTVDVAYPFLAGDTFKITSIVGSKSVRLIRDGVETSILYAQSPQSAWLELQPGDNNLRVYAEGAPIPYTIEYTNKYGGL